MRGIVFAALVAALPAGAQTSAELHAQAMRALERCESTWFQSRREAAAEEIMRAGRSLAIRLRPNNDEEGQMINEVTEALRRCTNIAYGS